MIWEELKEGLIYTEIKATNKEQVFEQMGHTLIEQGYVKESYVQALKDREAEYPTGLPTAIGVAIPHTSNEHVVQTTISIGVLSNPVPFVEMGTDDEVVDVKIIFMLAIAEAHGHIDVLQRILALIQDAEVLKSIQNARKSKEIIEIIRKKENTL